MQNKLKKKLAAIISSLYFKDDKHSFALTYHSVNNTKNNLTSKIYQLDEREFIDQINFLINKNIQFKKPSNLFEEDRGCLITFDDGYKSIIKNALDFLNKKNIPYILFVCPSKLLSNSKDYMSLIELKELVNMENVYVGSHSYNHIKLNELEEKKIISELKDSKNFLEQKLSVEVNTISYPFGAIDSRVLKIAEEIGYNSGFSTKFDFIKQGYNKLNLPRVDVWDGDNLKIFKNKVIGKWNWMRFFSKYQI